MTNEEFKELEIKALRVDPAAFVTLAENLTVLKSVKGHSFKYNYDGGVSMQKCSVLIFPEFNLAIPSYHLQTWVGILDKKELVKLQFEDGRLIAKAGRTVAEFLDCRTGKREGFNFKPVEFYKIHLIEEDIS